MDMVYIFGLSQTQQLTTLGRCSLHLLYLRARAWSSLVEGDEHLDWPNSQRTMELCHTFIVYYFWVEQKHYSFLLGPLQPSSPLLKSNGVSSHLVPAGDAVSNFFPPSCYIFTKWAKPGLFFVYFHSLHMANTAKIWL